MNLDKIKNALTSKLGRQILLTQKHSPTVLFAAGVVGVVTTAVLASRATLKLDEVLEDTQAKLELAKSLVHVDYTDEDRKRDMVLIHAKSVMRVGKLYGPAVIVGVLSIAALTGSHVILTRRNGALTAAYVTLDQAFRKYRSRVVDEYGQDKDEEYRFGTIQKDVTTVGKDGVSKTKTVKVVDPNGYSMYAKFFDEYNKNWQKEAEYNMLFLRTQQQYANHMLHARGHVLLNDVYDSLGIERTKAGCIVGWVLGSGDNFIDFGIFADDKERARAFVNGDERSIRLDFNVDGPIYQLLENGYGDACE